MSLRVLECDSVKRGLGETSRMEKGEGGVVHGYDGTIFIYSAYGGSATIQYRILFT